MKKGTHKINKKTFDTMKASQEVMKKVKVKSKDIATIMGMSAPTLNKLAKSDTYADYKATGKDKRDLVERDSDDVKTKQEQKNEAWVEYLAIVDTANRACKAIVNPAQEVYHARIKEIDEQDEQVKEQEDDGIRIIDGKKYKLIEEYE